MGIPAARKYRRGGALRKPDSASTVAPRPGADRRVKDRPPDLKARPPAPPWVACLRFRGLEQLRQRLTGGAPLPASTSSERLSGRLWIVDLGPFGVTGGTLDGPAFATGVCPPDVVAATLVLDAPAGGNINGMPLEAGRLLLFPPGGPYRGWSPAGYRWASAFVPRAEAGRLLREAGASPPRLRGASVHSARIATDDLQTLRHLLSDLDLERPRARPEPLPGAGAEALAGVWRRVLLSGWTRGTAAAATAASRRGDALLARADHYLREHLAHAVYLSDLAAATGAPARTLEHVFRRRLGLTPMQYLTWLRMLAARRLLTDRRKPAEAAVTETAHRVGFSHLGRFAAAYRRTFGETPLATLAAYAGRSRRRDALLDAAL